MTGREITINAVEMTGPPRVPIRHNADRDVSDVITWTFTPPKSFRPIDENESEWGFVWEKLDKTMGQPTRYPLISWDRMADYEAPNPHIPDRFSAFHDVKRRYADRYLLGTMGITGFNLMTFIRGFDNVLSDLYLEQGHLSDLADLVFGFEEGIISEYGRLGINAVAFYDDWGTQSSLMISPEQWRSFFKPRYKRQFSLAHSLDMHVYFHSCGFCYNIIPDLIEIGADIFNFNQPNIYGIERLGKDFGGKACFHCPVDIQTTAVHGNRDDIYRETELLINSLGNFNGGFIGLVEDYFSIGFISNSNYRDCLQALLDLGEYGAHDAS